MKPASRAVTAVAISADTTGMEELPNRQDCRISTYLNEVDPEDQEDWRRQHKWPTSRLNDMHRVFAGRASGRLMPTAGVAATAPTRLS